MINNHVIKRLLFILIVFTSSSLYAQSVNADVAANREAKKLKDTLSLTEAQKSQVFTFCKEFQLQKQSIKSKYSSKDSVEYYVQKIAVIRDSLYRYAMPLNKYEQFLLKKNNLVDNE